MNLKWQSCGSHCSDISRMLDVGCSSDLGVAVASTNETLAAWRARVASQGKQASWLELPWLLVECYM
jgi:hypothetical protein